MTNEVQALKAGVTDRNKIFTDQGYIKYLDCLVANSWVPQILVGLKSERNKPFVIQKTWIFACIIEIVPSFAAVHAYRHGWIIKNAWRFCWLYHGQFIPYSVTPLCPHGYDDQGDTAGTSVLGLDQFCNYTILTLHRLFETYILWYAMHLTYNKRNRDIYCPNQSSCF